jgi:hypothetical protein
MRALFDALLRFYEFDGPAAAKPAKAPSETEKHLLDLSSQDTSRFPYLP